MASPVAISENKASNTLISNNTTLQSPPAAISPSLAASRPRRSSANNTTRSTSMSRQSRSRGYSNSGNGNAAGAASSPYSSSPSSSSLSPAVSSHFPPLSSSADKRQQSKFERLFGSNSSSTSNSNHNHNGNHASTSPGSANLQYGARSLSGAPASSLPKSGIALTRRTGAAQRGHNLVGHGNGNGNGHTDMLPAGDSGIDNADEEDDDDDDEGEGEEDDTVLEYSSSPGGTKTLVRTSTGASTNSLGLGGINVKKGGSKKSDKLLRCERCHKVYHHPQSLIKHRWQHTQIWSDASRYGLSKHQTVQALEAAVILANPDTLRLLPNDKSHWPAAVSPPTSGLLGSEKLNIEILRKQAEVNERELEDQERAGNLRSGPPNVLSSGKRASSMQMYSKSMPANVGRRRSGLAFSLRNDMLDDDDEDDEENEEEGEDIEIKDDATMATETNDERGDDGDEDDDSTESEDENVIAGNLKSASEMESMDQDMFSLDISSSSPYARPSPLPSVAENGAHSTSAGIIPTSTRSGLSYSRKTYTAPSVALPAERYTFLPTIPSSSSLHMSDGFAGSMSAIPSASLRTRNRSSSHTRSTRDSEHSSQERGLRENSASSSTDESGVSATASVGAGTTGGSGDEAVSYATRDSGYVSTGQDLKSEVIQQQHVQNVGQTTPVRPAVDPAQTAGISMSAPVLGFFTERSPVSSFTNRGAPSTRQQAGHASPRVVPVDHTSNKTDSTNGFGNGSIPAVADAQAIPGYTPLEAQAAEILSSSYQSQSGPRSFSQTHFGSAYARSPGYHPYRPTSPFPSSARQLPSSSLSQGIAQQQQQQHTHSSSPSVAPAGQAYSFGQAPLGASYRSTSFNLASPANGQHKQFPMSPLAKPADTADGINGEDEDEIMDMDL